MRVWVPPARILSLYISELTYGNMAVCILQTFHLLTNAACAFAHMRVCQSELHIAGCCEHVVGVLVFVCVLVCVWACLVPHMCESVPLLGKSAARFASWHRAPLASRSLRTARPSWSGHLSSLWRRVAELTEERERERDRRRKLLKQPKNKELALGAALHSRTRPSHRRSVLVQTQRGNAAVFWLELEISYEWLSTLLFLCVLLLLCLPESKHIFFTFSTWCIFSLICVGLCMVCPPDDFLFMCTWFLFILDASALVYYQTLDVLVFAQMPGCVCLIGICVLGKGWWLLL